MKIRKLTINDYDEITKLWLRAKLPHKPRGRDSKEAIAIGMKANPEFFLGAFEENRLIGAVIITCDTRKGWINRLAVDPNYRKRGVATNLVDESEKILRKHGIRIFCALVEDGNVASQSFFKECGYIKHEDITYFSKRDGDEV
jgi:ribosomal protein S18 acetylase RimI-like enzyme